MLIYLCEDSESDVLRLKHYLTTFLTENHYKFEITDFSSGEELLEAYKETSKKPELLFLDIYMEGTNGVDTARQLRNLGYIGGIIFTTSSTEHAMESYEVNALYYLQKPYNKNHFINAMERCRPILIKTQQTFTYISKKKELSIPYADILFFETGQQHTVIMHTLHDTIAFSGSLSQITASFLQVENFLSVGRSFFINLNHVKGKQENDLIMRDNSIVQIPIRKQREILYAVEHWQKEHE